MASTEFKLVSWNESDPVIIDKLEAMTSNDNWLRDNMMRGRYSGNGVDRDIGIRIMAGVTLIPAGKGPREERSVSFGNYFSAGCKPVVTTGTVSAAQRQIHVVIEGPGSVLQPNRDGFRVKVFVDTINPKKRKIKRNFYVSWHAIGW